MSRVTLADIATKITSIEETIDKIKKVMNTAFVRTSPQALNYNQISQIKKNLDIDEVVSTSRLHKIFITHGGKDARFYILYNDEWRMGRLNNTPTYEADKLFGIDRFTVRYNRSKISIFVDKTYKEFMEDNTSEEIAIDFYQKDFEKMIDEGTVVMVESGYPDRYEIVHKTGIRLIPNSSAYYVDEWDELVDNRPSHTLSRIMKRKNVYGVV